jgi:hypothetical protein
MDRMTPKSRPSLDPPARQHGGLAAEHYKLAQMGGVWPALPGEFGLNPNEPHTKRKRPGERPLVSSLAMFFSVFAARSDHSDWRLDLAKRASSMTASFFANAGPPATRASLIRM